MPTPKRGPRLGAGPTHQRQLLANQARDLFRHGRIRTTEAKAKMLRPYAEKLITKAKQGDLAARRQVLSTLHDRDVVAYLFEEVAPRFSDRDGGYTRILKMEPRKGDNARMALIELVDRGDASGEGAIEESKASRSRGLFGRRRKQAAQTGAPAAAAGTAVLDEPADDEGGDDFDVEDDDQVAAAIAEATGAEASVDSVSSVSSVSSTSSVSSPEDAEDEDADSADGDDDTKA